MIVRELLSRSRLFSVLHRIDQDLAEECRVGGCEHCSGPLHDAGYLRKPRGEQVELPDLLRKRLSLCCGRRGCRRRALPPSVLFLGRRVYWAGVVWLVVAYRQQRPGSTSVDRLRRWLSVSAKTVERWLEFFREAFATQGAWKRVRGRIGAEVSERQLPASLLCAFARQGMDLELALLHGLCLMATGSTSRVGRQPDRVVCTLTEG